MRKPNVESPIKIDNTNQDYALPENAPFPDFPNPEEAIKGFGRLFNSVVKNVSERLPI